VRIFKKHELLDLITPYLPSNPVMVEAGTFDGTDTLKLAAHWPQATIHAFEPVPEIFELLERATAHVPSIHRYNLALSNANGTATFHVSEKPNRPNQPFKAGSLHEPHERLEWTSARYPRTITVPTMKVDDWAKQHSVDHIDFFWLDAQGHELAILQGAEEHLKNTRAIVTEVHFIDAYHGQPRYETIKEWLEERGFTQVAQDFTDQTTWFYGNALFVRG